MPWFGKRGRWGGCGRGDQVGWDEQRWDWWLQRWETVRWSGERAYGTQSWGGGLGWRATPVAPGDKWGVGSGVCLLGPSSWQRSEGVPSVCVSKSGGNNGCMPQPKGRPPPSPGLGTEVVDNPGSTRRGTGLWRIWEFMAYSAQGSCWLQEVVFWDATHRSTVSNYWFALSVWPLDCGWKPDDRQIDAPIRPQKAFQKLDVNWGPLSETTSTGKPCNLKTCWTISWAVSLAEGSLGRGMKWTDLENRSTTVRIVVLLSDRGRPVIKSSDTWDHGLLGTCRVGSGRSLIPSTDWTSLDELVDLLPHGRPRESSANEGLRSSGSRVTGQLGWMTPRKTCGRTELGTKRRLVGHWLGFTSLGWAAVTIDSISNWAAPRTQWGGRMVSSSWGLSRGLNRRDIASAFAFLWPGR